MTTPAGRPPPSSGRWSLPPSSRDDTPRSSLDSPSAPRPAGPSYGSASHGAGTGQGRSNVLAFLSSHGPVDEQLHHVKNAVVVAFDEVDALRRDMNLENAKLQREFRESVDVVIAASEQSIAQGSLPAHGSSTSLRHGDSSSGGTASSPREVQSRIEYLEHAVRALQNRSTAAPGPSMAASGGHNASSALSEAALAPHAVDATLRRMTEFMQRADEDIRSMNANVTSQLDAWRDRFEAMGRDHEDIRERVRERQMSPARQRGAPTTAPTGLNGDSDSRVSSNSFVTLNQVSNMINAQIVEVAALVDTEIAKMKENLASVKHDVTGADTRLAVMGETLSQVDADTADLRKTFDGQMVALQKAGATADDQMKRMRDFVEHFTLHESANIRDEVMQLVNNEASVQQRKIEDRQRRDESAAVRQDVIRTMTALERLQEEVGRVTQQQHTLYQSFQRSEHSMSAVQHKVDTEMRSELQRMEQVQKSFFSRQDQALAAERHTMQMRVQEEIRRLQEKHLEEVKGSEQRRLDDLQGTQQQIRDEFGSFVEAQRKENATLAAKLREDFQTASTQHAEQATRQLNTVNDMNKRAQTQALDEFRKATTRSSDEVRRLQNQFDDMSKRVNDQNQFLHTRMQQLMDEEVLRIERMGSEISLQLNNVVEEEVRRVVASTDSSTQRTIAQLEDRFNREIKTLRDETISCRSSLNALAAPSSSIQSVDARVDVLRKDMTELYETVRGTQSLEQRIVERSREESRVAIEAAKREVVGDVSHQLHRFDAVLLDLGREHAMRTEELSSLSLKVERISHHLAGGGTSQSQLASHRKPSSSYAAPPSAAAQHRQTSATPSSTTGGGGFGYEGSGIRGAADVGSPGDTGDRALDSLLASPVGARQAQPYHQQSSYAQQQQQPPPYQGGGQRTPRAGTAATSMVIPASRSSSAQQQYAGSSPSRGGDALQGAFDAF